MEKIPKKIWQTKCLPNSKKKYVIKNYDDANCSILSGGGNMERRNPWDRDYRKRLCTEMRGE